MLDLLCKIRDIDNIYYNKEIRDKFDLLLNNLIPIYFKMVQVKKLKKSIKKEKRIIVSLTTIPSRIDTVWIPITCMLHQTVRPDRIILWLGKEKFEGHEIPEKVKQLKEKGLEIRYCEDIRAHTKYYYTMQENPDDYVITIDDDIYYRKRMIEGLLKTLKKNPNMVCAHWVWEMRCTKGGTLLPSKLFKGGETAKNTQKPSHMLLALGVGGVLYPPQSLPKETFSIDKIKELSYAADDVWLKAMEILQGTKVAKVEERYKPDIIIENTQKVALRNSNVAKNQNDVQLSNVFHYYNIDLRKHK